MPSPGTDLGLLDEPTGYPQTNNQDVLKLRELKLAILEGRNPYYKPKVDLPNLQDHLLGAPILPVTNGFVYPTEADRNEDKGIVDERDTYANGLESNHNQSRIMSKDFGMNTSGDPDSAVENKTVQSGSAYTLGRHTLLSPVTSDSIDRAKRTRSTSNASTVIDTVESSTEPTTIKRESPPDQPLGSHPLNKDPTSSSLASFTSVVTASTAPTSESGVNGDISGIIKDDDVDMSGYDPKYGNKADYVRHQKARVKMMEEKGRRIGPRQNDRPPRQSQNLPRRPPAPRSSPTRGPEHVPKTVTLLPPSRTPSLSVREHSPTRRGPLDNRPTRLPSPHRPEARPASPPLASRYAIRPRDYSPSRDIRPQYLPYGDPVPAPVRPRPVVASPPRGSPPRALSASRAADRQTLDDYPRRNEARSFDLRPVSSSAIYAEPPSSRDNGLFGPTHDDAWGVATHGPPRSAPPRGSPPPRLDSNRERTSFSSSGLPANPIAGYRPQAVSNTIRYATPYDSSARRPDPPPPWPPREWEPGRPGEAKPKLQDRLAMDPYRERDDFGGPRAREFRREPSPGYPDGLRSGFRRPSDIETGIRPMKRSRPDESYPPGPSDGMRYDLPSRDYYPRDLRRMDDIEYDPRVLSSYGSYPGPP